jgi:hypothetical protein
MGLLEKNEFGDYILKEKAGVSGHVWVGNNLVPRLMFYSFFFVGAFGAEITIILLSIFVPWLTIETSFLFLTGMTAVAMTLFFIEGALLRRNVKT